MPKPTDPTAGHGLLPAPAAVPKPAEPVPLKPATILIRLRLQLAEAAVLLVGRLTPATNVMPAQQPNINVRPNRHPTVRVKSRPFPAAAQEELPAGNYVHPRPVVMPATRLIMTVVLCPVTHHMPQE